MCHYWELTHNSCVNISSVSGCFECVWRCEQRNEILSVLTAGSHGIVFPSAPRCRMLDGIQVSHTSRMRSVAVSFCKTCTNTGWWTIALGVGAVTRHHRVSGREGVSGWSALDRVSRKTDSPRSSERESVRSDSYFHAFLNGSINYWAGHYPKASWCWWEVWYSGCRHFLFNSPDTRPGRPTHDPPQPFPERSGEDHCSIRKNQSLGLIQGYAQNVKEEQKQLRNLNIEYLNLDLKY